MPSNFAKRANLLFWGVFFPFCFLDCAASKELALYQHCPRNDKEANHATREERNECISTIQALLPFHKSFEKSSESRAAKTQVATLIGRFFYEGMEWPEENRLLAFPQIQIPRKLICMFSPDRDPEGCGFSANLSSPTLAQRLALFLLKTPNTWIYHPTAYDNRKDINILAYARPGYRFHLYPSFWKEAPLDQMSFLMHEVLHYHSIPWHNLCDHPPLKGLRLCDEDLEQGRYSSNLLISELFLRSRVRQLKHLADPFDSKPSLNFDPRTVFAQLILSQCQRLDFINHPPPVPGELQPCNLRTVRAFLEHHKEEFGLREYDDWKTRQGLISTSSTAELGKGPIQSTGDH